MHNPYRPATATTIDLGSAPPLLADGSQHVFDRREVSLRWLAGAVLTGFTSTFLMGGALFVALDGRYTLAATPDELGVSGPVERSLQIGGGGRVAADSGSLRKADRLRVAGEQFATRQVLNLSTLSHVGDKDMVKVRPFVRVSASLAMRKTDLIAKIPPFNPMKLFTDADVGGRVSEVNNPAFYDAMVEGEVALRSSDLPTDLDSFAPEAVMATPEVERIVRDQARFLADGSIQIAALPSTANGTIDVQTADGQSAALAMKITQENVTFLTKMEQDKSGAQSGGGLDDKMINLSGSDSLVSVLRANQADDKLITDIVTAISASIDPKKIDRSFKLRLGLAKIDQSGKLKPVRVSVYSPTGHVVTVAFTDDGTFAAAQEPDADEDTNVDDQDEEAIAAADQVPTLYQSLYQTALSNDVPGDLVKDLVQMYSFDVDFNGRVRQGDSFEVFYGLNDEAGKAAPTEILYASLNIRGQLKRLYRYRSADDSLVDYYDETGKSAKKFMMRKPMDGGVLRSGFGGRRHPILGYYRMHSGVDWANPTGTPIYAAGNGVVEDASWHGGYGRFLKISHSNGYGSGYGHLSGYAKGIEKGAKVRQGQIVAYVGSTGLSTGPHLHYEVYINNVAVDPLRVRLPRGKELDGAMLADFRRERDRIDNLMTRGGGQKVAGR